MELTKEGIATLFAWVRMNNHSASDELVDFVFDSAKEKLAHLSKDSVEVKEKNHNIENLHHLHNCIRFAESQGKTELADKAEEVVFKMFELISELLSENEKRLNNKE